MLNLKRCSIHFSRHLQDDWNVFNIRCCYTPKTEVRHCKEAAEIFVLCNHVYSHLGHAQNINTVPATAGYYVRHPASNKLGLLTAEIMPLCTINFVHA
jgi:hypothetical protein